MTTDTVVPGPSPAITPSLRRSIAGLYRDYAAVFAGWERTADADRCERNASALEFGGDQGLAELLEGIA